MERASGAGVGGGRRGRASGPREGTPGSFRLSQWRMFAGCQQHLRGCEPLGARARSERPGGLVRHRTQRAGRSNNPLFGRHFEAGTERLFLAARCMSRQAVSSATSSMLSGGYGGGSHTYR